MTSLFTNPGATVALQTLRTIGQSLETEQSRISSGLRVKTAHDNAAYWSIATTMRSDNGAISAVMDAIGLGAAKIDTAYTGLDATVGLLREFRSKLVTAFEDAVDRAKVQTELDQFKEQLVSIAESASFSGVNWLDTTEADNLWELSTLPATVVSSFIRSPDNAVRVGTTTVELTDISLFNTGGGGALQADPRALGDIGGLRYAELNRTAAPGHQGWTMTGPLTLGALEEITLDVTVDSAVSHSLRIDKDIIDTALGRTTGTILNAVEYAYVLNRVMSDNGIMTMWAGSGGGNSVFLQTTEQTGNDASSIAISNVQHVPSGDAGGLTAAWAPNDGAYATDSFTFTSPFRVYRDVQFSFEFIVNNDEWEEVVVDRDFVDSVLGTSDGWINSATELASVLNAAAAGKGLVVSAWANDVVFAVDGPLYPQAGSRSSLATRNVLDNIGAAANFDILDVDITNPANDLRNYLSGVDSMLSRVTSGASALGAAKVRIDLQAEFAGSLMNSIASGVGRLVDADMNEASTRLKALQTQQQLSLQALQIANSSSENILQLFR